ncbi:hypothetical protein EFK95_13865 [Lactococcus lactis subsp. lactis]|uniref:Uncharacterized protein n=1 Tax=Lactococcus lactis TaxID=1358 RepID=A0A552YZS2_9LACT|nr:hypothetical protein [Lactococcus lactis]MCT0080587.1 hypothetical protein [Lactococcus lactis subsp. lactis]MDN5653280.1 hypothetical protein [Lactococcus lactis]TRW72721.1 hypothetical protein FNJ53_10440 [Lactococcus lactis]
MMKQTRCYICDKPIKPEWLPVGEFIVCDECSSDTDEKTAEKHQEQLNTAKKLLTALAHAECYTCGEKFEDNNCEFCSFAYPFCSQECYDNYMKNEGSGDE